MKKITTIDHLTLYVNERYYKVEINENATSAKSLGDLEDLERISSSFLEVDSISKVDGKFQITYELPEGYKSFSVAKNYQLVSKLQLIQRFLSFDPLADGSKTYLDLNNVFFKGFKDIKILYRSNGHLPYHSTTVLEQYKLFTLGFISSKFTYKKYLSNKDILLKKEDSNLLYKVNSTQSVSELKLLINEILIDEQASYHERVKYDLTQKSKKKKIAWIIRGALTILVVGSFLFGMQANKDSISATYEDEVNSLELNNEILLAASSGQVEEASKLMEKRGDAKEDIARLFLDTGMYDEAISYDEQMEEEVVERIYELNQKEKILTLSSESDFMILEKKIVEYNTDVLDNELPLIENKNTLKRLGLAYIENKDFDKLERLQEYLDDSELNVYVERYQVLDEINSLNQQIFNLTEDSEEDNEDLIISLNDQLVELQQKLISIEEKLGIDNQ